MGEKEEAFEEIQDAMKELTLAWNRLIGELKKPNILIIGKSGAGKSSLVNAIFGSNFAATGVGKPVTKHLNRYAPEDKTVVVYDTKGLEHGSHVEFIDDLRNFLTTLRCSNDLSDHLHIVWYVIDMAHARFQPFEKSICVDILKDIPLYFVINKIDTAERSQIDSVHQLVKEMRIPSCKGIFEVVSDRQSYNPTCCPICKMDTFSFRTKTREIICENASCEARTKMEKTEGLESLVNATINMLPDLARHSFINSQEVSQQIRLHVAIEVIIESAQKASLRSKETSKLMFDLATRLALLWNYRFFPYIINQEIAHHFYVVYRGKNLIERMALVIIDTLKSHRLSESLVIGMGVELCRMFCDIKMRTVGVVVAPNSTNLLNASSLFGGDAFQMTASPAGSPKKTESFSINSTAIGSGNTASLQIRNSAPAALSTQNNGQHGNDVRSRSEILKMNNLPPDLDSLLHINITPEFLKELEREIKTLGLDAAVELCMCRRVAVYEGGRFKK